MKTGFSKLHIGLRTLKTTAAVILSMIIVDLYGTTASKLIFAMLGAMSAVMPTFKESLESCLAQIVGVLFGAVAGVFLMSLRLPPLVATGIGIVLVITLYNVLRIRFSPSLPCFIVVMLCTGDNIQPFTYALGRIWDTTIGLSIGMLINMLIFPYDNSRQIRSTVESLDTDVIAFMEEMFDGDEILPDLNAASKKIDDISRQLTVFSNQKLLLHLRRQQHELEVFRDCEGKARSLVAHMNVLCSMPKPGRLSPENHARLTGYGANIRDQRVIQASPLEADIVTNYHVTQLLDLRHELLKALN